MSWVLDTEGFNLRNDHTTQERIGHAGKLEEI
jgi:hypothetical protein